MIDKRARHLKEPSPPVQASFNRYASINSVNKSNLTADLLKKGIPCVRLTVNVTLVTD